MSAMCTVHSGISVDAFVEVFFLKGRATDEIYTLPLRDALPFWCGLYVEVWSVRGGEVCRSQGWTYVAEATRKRG